MDQKTRQYRINAALASKRCWKRLANQLVYAGMYRESSDVIQYAFEADDRVTELAEKR